MPRAEAVHVPGRDFHSAGSLARRRRRFCDRRARIVGCDEEREAFDTVEVVGGERGIVEAPAEVRIAVLVEHDLAAALDVVARTADKCFMPLTVGGGVRTLGDVRRLLLAGADKVSINTAAVARPEFVSEAAEKVGSQAVVVAIDARRAGPGRFEVFTHGGRKPAGLDAVEWAREMARRGAGEILLTSMDRDGTKQGFDCELTRAVSDAVPVPVIASGGVGALGHFVDGVREGHASALLAASVFHFGTFTIAEVKASLAAAGIPVRQAG